MKLLLCRARLAHLGNWSGAFSQPRKVVHLFGSRQDEFYHDLSLLYARACDDCQELDRKSFHFVFAHVHMDGSWSFPENLTEKAVVAAKPMPIASALQRLADMKPDVMVPHMFCVEGMTRYRSLFDLLQIPFLGNHEYTIWPATDKATTKQLLESAGVQVPKGDLLVKGSVEYPQAVHVPFVVKPCNEDNSRGVTLVRYEDEALKAIEYAFSFDSRVLVEDFIAGREIRAACIEDVDGMLTVLPKIEYHVDDIRTSVHKLQTRLDGKLTTNAIAAAKKDGDRQCPADLSPQLHKRIDTMVKVAHKVLKCRHYSLYHIRVDADEQPYIIEAALFCSFSPLSVIPAMAVHSGCKDLQHPHYFHSLLKQVTDETRKNRVACASNKPISTTPKLLGTKWLQMWLVTTVTLLVLRRLCMEGMGFGSKAEFLHQIEDS